MTVPKAYIRGLLDGWDPVSAVRRRLLEGRIRELYPLEQMGLVGNINEMFDLFSRDPKARAIMTVARAKGLRYSEVRDSWSDDDLAAEIAWDARIAEDSWSRCQDCGIHRDELLDPDTKRPLASPAWEIERLDCYACAELRRNRDKLGEDEVKEGASVRWRPRAGKSDG